MNTSLPIYPYAEEIVNAVLDNDTVIITAETGSGKSTQVPQYLLQAGYKVVATQPRRIACVNLAQRVADELDDPGMVGYRTAFEALNADTAGILFCTDGLQLARGLSPNDKTVLIIDEVHEWNLNIETIIAWARKYKEDGHRIKTVLMSATLEAEDLARFFKHTGSVACVQIPGRQFEIKRKCVAEEKYHRIIVEGAARGKNVLAFRPGKREIFETIDALEDMLRTKGINAVVLPMHADLALEQQTLCFEKYDRPKIVVATNVAQTSLTIPDIDIVVDDGLEKRIETEDGIENLVCDDISHADIMQRSGRAGRTGAGEYWLCSRTPMEDRADYPVPDIKRMLLDQTMLRLYAAGMDPVSLTFFHQPPKKLLTEGKATLGLLKAIENNHITPIGRILASYPLSGRCAAMIEESKECGITDDILKIAAIIESGGIIRHKIRLADGEIKYVDYSDFTNEGRSDLLAEMFIFDKMREGSISDPEESGISLKSFGKAEEMYLKLKELVPCPDVREKRDASYYRRFLRCLYAGNPDRFFSDNSWEYVGISGAYKLSRNRCCDYDTDCVIGFPKIITFTNRYGFEDTLSIIDLVSTIPQEDVLDLLDPEYVTSEEMLRLSEKENSIYGDISYFYMGELLFMVKEVDMDSSDPDFGRYAEKLRKEERIRRTEKEERRDGFQCPRGAHREEIDIDGIVHYMCPQKDGRFHLYFINRDEVPDYEPENAGEPDIVFHFAGKRAESVIELNERLREYDKEVHNKTVLQGIAGRGIFTTPYDLAKAASGPVETVKMYNAEGNLEDMIVGIGLNKHHNSAYKVYPDLESSRAGGAEAARILFGKWAQEKFRTSLKKARKRSPHADFSEITERIRNFEIAKNETLESVSIENAAQCAKSLEKMYNKEIAPLLSRLESKPKKTLPGKKLLLPATAGISIADVSAAPTQISLPDREESSERQVAASHYISQIV